MKYLLALAGIFALFSPAFGQPAAKGEADYVQALEYLYQGEFDAAVPLLERAYESSKSLQVAETLVRAYYSNIEALAQSDDDQAIKEAYGRYRKNLADIFALHSSEPLFQAGLRLAFLLNDMEFAETLTEEYLKQNPQDPGAANLQAFISTRKDSSPDAVISAYAPIARSIPQSPQEIEFIVQARLALARSYQQKNQERRALTYLRLADRLYNLEDLRLASLEFLFLNAPYAVALMERTDFTLFSPDQRTLYLGALFEEGSPASLKKLDALLSSLPVLTPYEEALSLYRRGISPRALTALESSKDPVIRQFYPQLYLYLRYKILSRLKDEERLVPVLESLGGQAYLLQKFDKALSYLTNLKENKKGELSYLLGSLYLHKRDYAQAEAYFKAHLEQPEGRYKENTFIELINITLKKGDLTAAEDYLTRYENVQEKIAPSNGQDVALREATVSRGYLALKQEDFAKAKNIFSAYFSQLYSPNIRKTAAYHISSLYFVEWMESQKNRDILLKEALRYVNFSYEIMRSQTSSPFDLSIYNLYAYVHAQYSAEDISPEALDAARYISSQASYPEFLDTAAVAFFYAGRIDGDRDSAAFYFDALEKEMALLDEEIQYAKTLAPPFFDESTGKNPRFYEIYAHLSAWYRYRGQMELSQKAAQEALRLAENRESVRSYLNALYQTWKP